jgi:uncharacterized protein (TIGR03083 family)
MQRNERIDVLRDAADRAARAADGALDVAVPSCPGWSLADLLAHMTTVVGFWGAIAAGGEDPPTDWAPPPRPDDADVIAWYQAEVDQALAALASLDPDTPRWTWAPPHNAGFIQRRMAQEFAVHAWDAENAIGSGRPIESAVAAEGIDEFLGTFVPNQATALEGDPLAVHLHTTDADGEWMLAIGEGNHHLERVHGKGDVAVRGPASDLLLALWGRAPIDGEGVEVFGDRAVLAAFVERIGKF